MPRVAANLSMMYVEHPFLERFGGEGPLAVRSILDDLVRENALITLYCPERHEDFVVSRLLRRDDGELVVINLDQYSQVEILDTKAAG